MKTKILAGIIILLVVAAVGSAIWWWWRPQTITFDDGAKVTLLAVQYGTHHQPPKISGSGRTRSITTTNDTLVAWFLETYDRQDYHSFQFYACDKAMTACADALGGYGGQQGKQVVGVRVNAFPRRHGTFLLRVQEQSNDGQEVADKSFVVHAPHADYSLWTPDPLPDTQDDQDLSVTLTKLVAGASAQIVRNNDNPDDVMNKGVEASFQVSRNGHSVSNWQPVSVQTTDATGNAVNGQVFNNRWNNDEDTVDYQFGLWPDEPAWKIRFEFSQQSDFTPEESWFVPNIPVEPGKMQDYYNGLNNRRGSQNNAPFAESDLNGYHLKIFSAKQFTDMPPNSQPQGGLSIQITPPLSDGMRLTIVRLTDNQTNDISFYQNVNGMRGASVTQCQLQNLDGATNLNLTIALHKSRFVEFTAKPDVAPPPPPDNSQ
jgi:hypothetical protein